MQKYLHHKIFFPIFAADIIKLYIMGLLKSIFDIAIKAAADAINEKAGQKGYNKDEETHYNRDERPAASYRAQNAQPAPSAQEPIEIVRTPMEWEAYFDEIIRTNFPQFNVKRNVPVTDLTGFTADVFQLYTTRPYQTYKAEWGKPYTFVLYRGERPAGVVMLGDGQTHAQNVKYLISRMYCKKLGMPYINFYTQMPNEREYVIQRIKDLMLGH